METPVNQRSLSIPEGYKRDYSKVENCRGGRYRNFNGKVLTQCNCYWYCTSQLESDNHWKFMEGREKMRYIPDSRHSMNTRFKNQNRNPPNPTNGLGQ